MSTLGRLRERLRTSPQVRAGVRALRQWQLRRQLAASYPPAPLPLLERGDGTPPTLANPVSQLCTASQFLEPRYTGWCAEMLAGPRLARKQWEFVYILEVLGQAGMLAPGRRGLGFGCGREPLVATIASRDAAVLATDLGADEAGAQGWIDSGLHSSNLEQLNINGICPPETFRRNVAFEFCDMNAIPPAYAGGFDFVWSACSLEHLGSIDKGLDFIVNAMACLKPGGIAVHTTEFNLSSDGETVDHAGTVLFRRQDIERLAKRLAAIGATLATRNYHFGTQPVDRHVDVPPYADAPHLKLQIERYASTSIGLIIRKG